MTSTTLWMFIPLFTGMLLGVLFFGGLWLTVKYAVHSSLAGLWFVASFITRVATTVYGFYFVSNNRWENMAVSLIGFLIVRFAITKVIKIKKYTGHEN